MEKNELCGALIKKVHDEIEKKANAMLRQQDLTLSQMNVLMELEAIPNHQLTLKELESLLHVANPRLPELWSVWNRRDLWKAPQMRTIAESKK